jgi:hypothetical protein
MLGGKHGCRFLQSFVHPQITDTGIVLRVTNRKNNLYVTHRINCVFKGTVQGSWTSIDTRINHLVWEKEIHRQSGNAG